MSNIKNVRFFLEREIEGYHPVSSSVFLTYENQLGQTIGYDPDNEMHFSFSHDGIDSLEDSLEHCTEISLEEYKELSKGYTTPKIYLIDELEWFEKPKNVKEFLQNASNYIKTNGEYPSDDPEKPIHFKTDEEIQFIMSNRESFQKYYDVLKDEADYHGLKVEDILSEIDKRGLELDSSKQMITIYSPYNIYVFNDVHLDAEYDYGPSDFNLSEGLEHLLERIVVGEVEPEPNLDGFVELDIDVEGVVLVVDDSGSLPKVIEFYADSYELNEQKNPLVHLNADLPVKKSTKLLHLYKNALEQQAVHSIDDFEWLNGPSAEEHPSYYEGLVDGLESSICALGEINQEQLMQLKESWEKDINERSMSDEKMKKSPTELEI